MPRVGHLRESLWNPNVRMEKIDEVFTFFSWGKKKKKKSIVQNSKFLLHRLLLVSRLL